MGERGRPAGARNALVVLIVLVAIVIVVAIAFRRVGGGRQPGMTPLPTDTPETTVTRQVVREPPLREVIVLEETQTEEGFVERLVVVPADADAYIASGWPTQNFGMGDLHLGYSLNDFGAERILLRFDVRDISRGSAIESAGLRLHVRDSIPPDDVPLASQLRPLASPWDELDVTWRDGPERGRIREFADVNSARRWYEWDATSIVRDWTSGALENYGMLLIGYEAVQQHERVFYSRETPVGGPAGQFYPQLVIEYTAYDDLEVPTSEVAPLPNYVPPDFIVSWSGEDRGGAGIASYDVQYRVDGGEWIVWLTDVAFTSASFEGGENGRLYEFRVRARDRAGNLEPFGGAEASTTVDSEPPTSTASCMSGVIRERSFNVFWTGEDEGAGILYYDVRYRIDGGEWIPWQQQTIATSATFTTMEDGQYEFEARAVDQLGLKEPFTGQPQASITVDAREPFTEPG